MVDILRNLTDEELHEAQRLYKALELLGLDSKKLDDLIELLDNYQKIIERINNLSNDVEMLTNDMKSITFDKDARNRNEEKKSTEDLFSALNDVVNS